MRSVKQRWNKLAIDSWPWHFGNYATLKSSGPTFCSRDRIHSELQWRYRVCKCRPFSSTLEQLSTSETPFSDHANTSNEVNRPNRTSSWDLWAPLTERCFFALFRRISVIALPWRFLRVQRQSTTSSNQMTLQVSWINLFRSKDMSFFLYWV